jgi:hypothetical protein
MKVSVLNQNYILFHVAVFLKRQMVDSGLSFV